jgi:hypothetical protein
VETSASFEARSAPRSYPTPLGHIRLYEAGNTYDMPPALAHAAAKRDLVAAQRPVDWGPPSILSPPEVLAEAEISRSRS